MKNTLEEKLNMVLEKLTAFSKAKYLKADIESELRKLQKEIVTLVFDTEHALNSRLTIWDVYYHFVQKNAELGGVADGLMKKFQEQCFSFSNLIKAEISGNRGESLTAQRLSYLHGQHKILHNIELSNEDGTTELDFVVFTSRAVFILEVKNTRKQVLVDEFGDYYKVGDFTRFDCNLKNKMNFREMLLRKKLEEAMPHLIQDMNVVKLVIFTNKEVELHNKCKELQTCFLAQLPYIIDDFAGEDLYSAEDITVMAEALSSANNTQEYEFEMDMQKFKEDFATILVTLETAEEKEEGVEESVIEKTEIPTTTSESKPVQNSKIYEILGWASGIAVVVGIGALVSKALVKR